MKNKKIAKLRKEIDAAEKENSLHGGSRGQL